MGKKRIPAAKLPKQSSNKRREVEFEDETSLRHKKRIEREEEHERKHPQAR